MLSWKLARRAIASASLTASLVCAAPALAGTVIIQNDNGAGTTVVVGFEVGEQVAAWLGPMPCDGIITEVQIGWGSQFGGQPNSVEEEIHIFRSGPFPTPGIEVTAGELLGPQMVDGFINAFPIGDLGFTVSQGETIIVSLEIGVASSQSGVGPAHDGQPGMPGDPECQQGRNAIFCTGGICFGWTNSCLFLGGDWVIRVVIDCSGVIEGACCLVDGTCLSNQTSADCATAGGTFQGANSDCGMVNCPVPMGACCFGDASCTDNLTPTDCANQLGVFQGDGSLCSGVTCPLVEGACCFADFPGFCSNLTEADCTTARGVWQGPATDCATTTCSAACCLPDGSCTDVTVQPQCDAVGGLFQGDGTDCGTVMCPAPQGACCLANGSCLESQTEANCMGIPGASWAGAGTSCVPDCTPLGACCLSNGSCLADQTQANCEEIPGATWAGANTLCPDDCTTSCPYDCAVPPDGQVTVVDLLELLSQWGGPGSCDNGSDGMTPNNTVDVVDLLALLAAWGGCQ